MKKIVEVEYHAAKPEIRVGSLITARHNGYHRVVRLFTEDEGFGYASRCVAYRKVINVNGKKSNSKVVQECHIDYCELVDIDDTWGKEFDACSRYLCKLYHNLLNAVNHD